MNLNTRGVLDPRFPFFARPVLRGAMMAEGVLLKVVPADPDAAWNPWAVDPAQRTPHAAVLETPVYMGRCRVQPNQDWRARPIAAQSEDIVEQSTRIQIDFHGNLLTGGIELGDDVYPSDDLFFAEGGNGTDFPIIRVNYVFRVTKVFALDGVEVDSQLKSHTHIVRNIVPSSNSWVRTLSCATDMTRVGEYVAQ